MTADERTRIAESLMAVAFSLREDDGPKGQAWMMAVASTMTACAVLEATGPGGEVANVLVLVQAQTRQIVEETQLAFFRDRLTVVENGKN